MRNNLLLSTGLILALSACGKADNKTASANATQAPAAQDQTLATNGTGNNYVTASPLRFVGADGKNGTLPGGTNVTMLETKNGLVHLGVDSDDAALPSEAWVKASDMAAARLEAQQESDLIDEDFNESPFEDAGRRASGGMTYCYRYVKQYLQNHGLVKGYLPGASAWMAASILQSRGWHSIGSPANAKINDVCVYRGGRGGNGHAEVRVPGGWYYGYGVKSNPISRNNHPFVGCYSK